MKKIIMAIEGIVASVGIIFLWSMEMGIWWKMGLSLTLIVAAVKFISRSHYIPVDNALSTLVVVFISTSIISFSIGMPVLSDDLKDVSCAGFVNHKSSRVSPGVYSSIIEMESKRYGLDPDLIKGLITVESGWRPDAVSSTGCVGLMQLCRRTAREMGLEVGHGVDQRYDPEENIRAGCKYLAMMLVRSDGDLSEALAYYNVGPNASAIKIARAKKGYAVKVMAAAQRF